MRIRYYLPILTMSFLFGCFQEPEFALEPEIVFERILIDTQTPEDEQIPRDVVTLIISFKDGDGNLGLDINGEDKDNDDFILGYQQDSLGNFELQNGERIPIYRDNYLLNVYKKIDDSFELIEFPDGQDFSGSFPILNTSDREKALEGEIDFTFDIFFTLLPVLERGDEVKFEIQIEDRALNLSNIVETTSILIGEN